MPILDLLFSLQVVCLYVCMWVFVCAFPTKTVLYVLPFIGQTCFLDSTIDIGDLFILSHTDDDL